MTATAELRCISREQVQPYLAQLTSWLLPGSFYGVQHTWPVLYRRDGGGRFFGVFAGERLLAHCAVRDVTLRTAAGPRRVALLGSVATDPDERGMGLATRVLQAALDDCRVRRLDAVLLWAERPDLYARCGFAPGPEERCLLVAALGATSPAVRQATVHDHPRLLCLHADKPLGVLRDAHTMSGLLTTPGMWTFVLEQGGVVQAYACCGKGADLQNWWHEVGGDDDAIAELVPAAMCALAAPESFALLPPYRGGLPGRLGAHCVEQATIAGPMVCTLGGPPLPATWIDGLDSV